MKNIYIYSDDGVSADSLRHTMKMLRGLGLSCKSVKASDIVGGILKECDLFIMPGGADVPYHEKLSGSGTNAIKKFVHRGGAYLGICAGAYFASSYVKFDVGGAHHIEGARELRFIDGCATGPVIGGYSPHDNSCACTCDISMGDDTVTLFFHAGPYFDVNDGVIATYAHNEKPAIVYIRYGSGNVVLSGPHFEYDCRSFNNSDKFLMDLCPMLLLNEKLRQSVVSKVFGYLDR